jgi:response regulator of citrate/malate metabolism
MINVIVVEDDPMVAHINRECLAKFPDVSVAAWLASGREALRWLKANEVDLMILEAKLPDLNGLELLRLARRNGYKVDAIMVTAARDAELVEELLRLGVVDYLVKPFVESRFKEAMLKYLAKKETLKSGGDLDQARIDRLLSGVPAKASFELPKGLQSNTWNLIRDRLAQGRGQFLDCEDVAERVELSKVTIRRYLKHMAESRLVECRVDYETGGRPSVRYRLADGVFSEQKPGP